MTDKPAENPPAKPKAAAAKAPSSGFPVGMLLFIIILAIAGAAGWRGWQEFEAGYRDFQQERADLKRQVAALQSQVAAAETRYADRDSIVEVLDGVTRNRIALEDRIAQLEASLVTLRNQSNTGQANWLRAEARHLIRIAMDELDLRGNVGNALLALKAADRVLRDLDDSASRAARARLAQDITLLESLPNPDVTGMALSLGSFANIAARLPLANALRVATTEPPAEAAEERSWWQRFTDSSREFFNALVTVRRNENIAPLLAPEEEFFLRQNLALKIETARMAVLQRDHDNLKSSLTAASEWIDDYFDTDSAVVAGVRAELQRIAATEFPDNYPDLGTTLGLLDAENNQ